YCREITRDDPYRIGRIIARPFVGTKAGEFTRTANRRDFALKPFGRTTMNELKDHGLEVIALGKITDIYDGEGITRTIRTESNIDGMDKFVATFDEPFTWLSFINLVDFDSKYGHRRDPKCYSLALEVFDPPPPEGF